MALGLLLAAGSGTFAAHSISTNTGQPNLPAILPAGDLMTWKKGIGEFRLARRDLDPLTTGSIPSQGEEVRGASGQNAEDGRSIERKLISDYVLLDVAGGVAFVESADGVRQVRPGSVLPGAGRVGAIERADTGWTVVTSQGVIRELR